MKFHKKIYTRGTIALAMTASMRAVSFAGISNNIINDVPSSPNENRTIQTSTTLYTSSCDISQELAFYTGSPVYLRIAQPKGPVSYVFDKTATYVIVYGGPVFAGNIRFPYVSNFVPSTTIDTNSSNVLTVDVTGATFLGQSGTPRNQIAGQVVTKNNERSIIQNAGGSLLNYYYRWSSDLSSHNGTLNIIINPSITQKISCTNYYVARCGDGTTDKATGTSDGNGGLQTQGGIFLPWHTRSIKPNEVCDDGALNGTPGHCKTDCTGLAGGNSCTLTASATSIQAGQSVTLSASYTSGTSATFSPSLSGITFTYPNRSDNAIIDTPTTTTTYSLTVNGAAGSTPSVCTTSVEVVQPVPHLQCTLTLSPNPVQPNQIVAVGWNVTNGNFFGTYIYITPSIVGAWPHWINANQYNGVSSVMPTQTGDYTFSMMVNNNTEQSTCTGVLHVRDNIPSTCSLTTTTPTILPGQTATLSASYANAALATFTPNVGGVNFVYPNRSSTNISVTPTVTTTYTLTTLGNFGSGQTCTTTINVMNTGVTLNKSLITNIAYHSGDLVSFRINFSNLGASTVNHVILSDYLPAGLEYVNSQIFGVAPYTFGTGALQGNQFVEYSGFSLTPGQQGYIIITGKFKGYQYSNQTLNNSFLQADNSPTLYSSALFTAYIPSGNASAIKTSNKSSYYLGEDARFTIAVTNNGPDAINTVVITDDRPNSSCVTLDSQWTSNMPLTMTNATDPFAWTYNGSLSVGQTIYLYLTGHIGTPTSCAGNYINNSSIRYTMNGSIQTGNAAPLNFSVSNVPNSTMSFEKKIVQYGSVTGDPVIFELVYQNNGSATITNYDIVDYWPGTLNFVSATPMPTTQTVTSGGALLHWIVTTPIAPNGSGKIIINGTLR